MTTKHMRLFGIAALMLMMVGCSAAQQRGMVGSAYVSTARPAIAVEAKNMPLLTAGRGSANLTRSSMAGGLPIRVWLAVYGAGDISPMAVVAQAEVPQGWYWDGIMRRPFSVDDGVEVFDGVGYQACTYIVDSSRDPFGALVAGKTPEGRPVRWLARGFAARYNFNDDKIIMEYREPLPAGIESLSALPLGAADTLKDFEQRARETFSVGPVPADLSPLRQGYAQGVQWQYMDESFLGTVSQYDFFNDN
ncbi:DUF4851 domain-containing protein [Desulfovibrio porci]|uniref:DUF4851 domain-containing protein n=1 Tax=Desulfovibrio porci TaxID=2605782 RepID=UPI002A81F65D|nr:DUF4851 domain-containing protein [Desulfovibrio porci]MDY3809024.1 DUF4851 domain-containing protein [Desulfovibrio porci]